MKEEGGIDLDTANIYVEQYAAHREAGDDSENARMRIIEEGCPVSVALKIQAAFGETDEEDSDDC